MRKIEVNYLKKRVLEMISVRAYELYELRGRQAGQDLEDWLEAEREILSGIRERQEREAQDMQRGW